MCLAAQSARCSIILSSFKIDVSGTAVCAAVLDALPAFGARHGTVRLNTVARTQVGDMHGPPDRVAVLLDGRAVCRLHGTTESTDPWSALTLTQAQAGLSGVLQHSV